MRTLLLLCLLAFTQSAQLIAQEIPAAVVEKEHAWLKKFVGEWECNSKAPATPGSPAMECSGVMTSSMLGDLWLVNKVENKMQGVSVHAIQTIGFDAKKKKFVGTWVDSMMNHLWHYEGTLDAEGKTLTLEADGPDFADPSKTAKFRDSYEFKSPDHIIGTSSMQNQDGKWEVFMTGEFRRSK